MQILTVQHKQYGFSVHVHMHSVFKGARWGQNPSETRVCQRVFLLQVPRYLDEVWKFKAGQVRAEVWVS